MLKNKIFVTSRPNGSTLNLVKDIFKHTKKPFPEKLVNDRLIETKGDIVGFKIPYEIVTKYYTANVDFWLDEVDQKDAKDTIEAYCKEDKDISKVIDAFVYIFDKNEISTFTTVKEWLPLIEQAQPEIRVCIGTSSEEPLRDKDYNEISEWCAAHQFDFVDMDEKSDIPMDKVGLDLIVDILQTNFWQGRTEQHENDEGTEEAVSSELAGILGSMRNSSRKSGTPTGNEFEETDDHYVDFDMPSAKEIDDMSKKLWCNMDDEDGLEKAFQLMQTMREQGKQMSDNDRRKMAATVALAFTAQLDMD